MHQFKYIYVASLYTNHQKSSNHLVSLEDTSVHRYSKPEFQSFDVFYNKDMRAPTGLKGIREFITTKTIFIVNQLTFIVKQSTRKFQQHSVIKQNKRIFIPNDYIPESNMFSSCFSEGLSSLLLSNPGITVNLYKSCALFSQPVSYSDHILLLFCI